MLLREAIKFKPELVTKYIEKGFWVDETLNSHLKHYAVNSPESLAIIHPDGELTYKELDEQVEQLTNGLLGLGLTKGDVVSVQLPNTIEFILCYFAITAFGGIMQTGSSILTKLPSSKFFGSTTLVVCTLVKILNSLAQRTS